jgi:hypothetical protein
MSSTNTNSLCEVCDDETNTINEKKKKKKNKVITLYKCPKCLIKYCSIKCYKVHTAADTTTCATNRINRKIKEEEDNNNNNKSALEEDEEEELRNKKTDSNNKNKPKRKFEEDEEDLLKHRLRREDFNKLALNDSILLKLQSERLFETLRFVDSSKEGFGTVALENALLNEDFKEFCDEVLDCLEEEEE